jgi:hypothetical protein
MRLRFCEIRGRRSLPRSGDFGGDLLLLSRGFFYFFFFFPVSRKHKPHLRTWAPVADIKQTALAG